MDLNDKWLEQDKKEINLKEFNHLGELIFKQKSLVDELEKQKKQAAEGLDELLHKADKIMAHAGIEKQHIPGYGLLFFKEYSRVSAPKEVSDKQELADYFKKKGIFWEMFSVNSQTLNSYFNAERNTLEGDDKLNFKLPGCTLPTVARKLETRKGK